MSLRLPVLRSVDRTRRIDPHLIPDPSGGSLAVVYGPRPDDPSPLLCPFDAGRVLATRPAGEGRRGRT
jgi:hypothetical protein